MHGTQVVALYDTLLRRLGGLEGFGPTYGKVGIELEVQVVDALQVGCRHLDRGDLFCRDQTGKLRDRKKGDVAFIHSKSFPLLENLTHAR